MERDAEPVLRPARPDDLEACAPLVALAGGPLLAWGLGDADPSACERLVRRCWEDGRHPLGARNTTVATLEGRVVGCCLGAAPRRWAEQEHRARVPIADLVPDATRLHARLDLQARHRPPLPGDAWYLASLAVDPAYRRRGLARILLADATRRASGRDLLVEVVATNAAAVGLYRRVGFRDDGRWQAPGGPEVLRLRGTVARR